MNKFVLTHSYNLDISVDSNTIRLKKKFESIKNVIVISTNDSIILYDDFAFRITTNPVEKTTSIHSSKPLYINKTDNFLDLELA